MNSLPSYGLFYYYYFFFYQSIKLSYFIDFNFNLNASKNTKYIEYISNKNKKEKKRERRKSNMKILNSQVPVSILI